ncbi:MAG TPA: NRDE family protein, partial [Pyrinomonadaceae bacterium]
RSGSISALDPGIYGLSNHLLDTPWPKVAKGKSRLTEILANGGKNQEMFHLLADRTLADDADLPDTGIGYEKEKFLSAIFIETPIYGTRCSTVVTADANGKFEFEERVFV